MLLQSPESTHQSTPETVNTNVCSSRTSNRTIDPNDGDESRAAELAGSIRRSHISPACCAHDRFQGRRRSSGEPFASGRYDGILVSGRFATGCELAATLANGVLVRISIWARNSVCNWTDY